MILDRRYSSSLIILNSDASSYSHDSTSINGNNSINDQQLALLPSIQNNMDENSEQNISDRYFRSNQFNYDTNLGSSGTKISLK